MPPLLRQKTSSWPKFFDNNLPLTITSRKQYQRKQYSFNFNKISNVILCVKCFTLSTKFFNIFILLIILQTCFSLSLTHSSSNDALQPTFTELLKIQKAKADEFDGKSFTFNNLNFKKYS